MELFESWIQMKMTISATRRGKHKVILRGDITWYAPNLTIEKLMPLAQPGSKYCIQPRVRNVKFSEQYDLPLPELECQMTGPYKWKWDDFEQFLSCKLPGKMFGKGIRHGNGNVYTESTLVVVMKLQFGRGIVFEKTSRYRVLISIGELFIFCVPRDVDERSCQIVNRKNPSAFS